MLEAVHRRPHRVNEVALLERIPSLVDEKELDGIADLRDESDRDGPKRDVVADAVRNNLPKKTPLWTTSSSGNFLALFLDDESQNIARGTYFDEKWTVGTGSTSSPRSYHR